jgi:hypothetical protein
MNTQLLLRRPFLTEGEAMAQLGLSAQDHPQWLEFCKRSSLGVHKVAGSRIVHRDKFYRAVLVAISRTDDIAKVSQP